MASYHACALVLGHDRAAVANSSPDAKNEGEAVTGDEDYRSQY